jgi:DNA-binding response OmpR family regulator
MDSVLIVDDDANVRELLQSYLEARGYRVSTSADGWDAVREIVVRRPDLVLMDINMPKLNGLGALDILRMTQVADNLPIIITSSDGDKETILKAAQLGADDFIVKPFSFAELASRIASQLYRLDFATLHKVLQQIEREKTTSAIPGWPSLDPNKYRDWTAYPVAHEGRELWILLRKGMDTTQAASLDEEKAELSVMALVKHRQLWKCAWPKPK